MEFTDTELDILKYGLQDHLVYLGRFLSFGAAKAIAETKRLVSRIEHEQIQRQIQRRKK